MTPSTFLQVTTLSPVKGHVQQYFPQKHWNGTVQYRILTVQYNTEKLHSALYDSSACNLIASHMATCSYDLFFIVPMILGETIYSHFEAPHTSSNFHLKPGMAYLLYYTVY